MTDTRALSEQLPLWIRDERRLFRRPSTPDGAPDAIAIGMELLANGELQLRSQRSLPMSEAAEAHRLLEEEGVREKLLLTTAAVA